MDADFPDQGSDRDRADDRQVDRTPIESPLVIIPVGTHAIRVPSDLAICLQALAHERSPVLDGTRVWIRRMNNNLELHLGDVDSSLED